MVSTHQVAGSTPAGGAFEGPFRSVTGLVPAQTPVLPSSDSSGSQHLDRPIVGMSTSSDRSGYRMVASDGGIIAFGAGASFAGSMGRTRLNRPVSGWRGTDPCRGRRCPT
jgi:hypothetical protein